MPRDSWSSMARPSQASVTCTTTGFANCRFWLRPGKLTAPASSQRQKRVGLSKSIEKDAQKAGFEWRRQALCIYQDSDIATLGELSSQGSRCQETDVPWLTACPPAWTYVIAPQMQLSSRGAALTGCFSGLVPGRTPVSEMRCWRESPFRISRQWRSSSSRSS